MRIIQEGKIPNEIEYITSCSKCKTKFAFYRKEATVFCEKNESVFIINCPFCKEKVYKSCS